MTHQDLTDLLDRAAERTDVGPAPLDEMLRARRRRRRSWLAVGTASALVTVVALGIAVIGSAGDPRPEPTPDGTPTLPLVGNLQGHWRLTAATIDGQTISTTWDVSWPTLWVNSSNQGQANAACNGATIRVDSRGARVRFQVTPFVMLSCMVQTGDPTDGGYHDALRAVDTAAVTATTLTLTGRGTELVFQRMDRGGGPADPTLIESLPDLDGTWVVTALTERNGSSALTDAFQGRVRLTFEDDEMHGETGCNDFGGGYTQSGTDGKDLRFSVIASTHAGCVLGRDAPLIRRLGDVRHVTSYVRNGERLLQLHASNWMIAAVLTPVDGAGGS